MSDRAVLVSLPTLEGEAIAAVVELLEHYLELARQGRVVSIGIATVARNRGVAVEMTGGELPSLLGATALLHHRALTLATEASDN